MTALKEQLSQFGVIPVITLKDAAAAAPLARALKQGGLPVVEITFRTAAAAEAIREIKRTFPDMLVGAGTILTRDQLREAESAGADFLVAPGLNPDMVRAARTRNIPFIPGCMTASEVEQALGLGLDLVKFFPAEAAGACRMIRAFNGPYPDMAYMPTGGISPENLPDYLTTPNIICCGGSWIAPEALIAAGDFAAITDNARAAAEKIKTIRRS